MGRTPCCNVEGLKKGAWTADEDQKLIAYIQKRGEGGWRLLPQKAGLQRCGKSCRLRWANYLRPDIKRGEFNQQEEQTIIQLHATLGNRWSAIAKHLPRRTDNEIKNYWNTHLKKRLAKIGTDDQVTDHKPVGATLSPSHNDSNNVANPSHTHMWDSDALLESKASLHKPGSSSFTSVSAQLLNNIAAKVAPLQSLASQSVESRSTEGGGDGSGNVAGDVSTSSVSSKSNVKNLTLVLSSLENPLRMSRSTSTSNLLNKMATTLTTPLHCLDTLKTILSMSTKGGAHNGNDTRNGDASGNGGVSDVSIGDSYNIESPISISNFLINSPELLLANGSSKSSGFLGTCQRDKAFDSHCILPTEPTQTEDYNFMEGITNFLLGDHNEQVIPTSSGD